MRPTIVELTDSFSAALTPVPRVRRGVCDLCHGGVEDVYRRCWSCEQTASEVAHPAAVVVPISLCERGSQLHHVLRNYKDNRRPQVRHQFTRLMGALIGRFLDRHADCIAAAAGSRWDYLTTVPSTRQRPGPRPLEDAIAMVKELALAHRRTLAPGATPVDRLHPSDDNFRVIDDVTHDTILLLDDTYTTGTSVQSAASALAAAGAKVAGVLVVGRFVNPDYNPPSAALWESVRSVSFDFETCCLHQR